jgi:hypothetical protein
MQKRFEKLTVVQLAKKFTLDFYGNGNVEKVSLVTYCNWLMQMNNPSRFTGKSKVALKNMWKL